MVGRYHLYVALICPWASRTLIGRKVKKLEDVISLSVVDPILTDEGWRFADHHGGRDALTGATYLHQIYTRADPNFTGRATVPVLWDKKRGTIVNNESADILRMFNSGFGSLADTSVDLYPAELCEEIDALNARIYAKLNNGVYRAGFATTQEAYEEAFADVFTMLDELEARLANGRAFLFGGRFTETDIRLFVTLVRHCAARAGITWSWSGKLSQHPGHLPGMVMLNLASLEPTTVTAAVGLLWLRPLSKSEILARGATWLKRADRGALTEVLHRQLMILPRIEKDR